MENLRRKSIELYTRVVDGEEGQGMVEYALILFLVSIVAIAFLTAIGVDTKEVFDAVENALGGDDDVADPTPPAAP